MSIRGHLSQAPSSASVFVPGAGADGGPPTVCLAALLVGSTLKCAGRALKVKGEQLACHSSLWSCDTSAGEERARAADHTIVMQLAEPKECEAILIEVRWSPVQALLLGHRNERRSPVKDDFKGQHLKWFLVEYVQ